ncbi:LysR family transcriptional regulator [Marinobacterium nitratireducens]|uniref:LysR family transcriptional regulator n=1 Tax=Marinobacterium nitratireducens TaxID=518897 RepID=A0A917ZI12_9GAMM|nr:LysR family transcriptional regulator [Marinobacterium nitratireducens]GGO83485.1 LysR family transcriptional regulator [Marinobacterium nitratireducens]
MEPKHLVQLAAILDCGSINLAARKLNVTQPTLTRNMQTLEMQAGGSLFNRSRHGVRQTPLGEALAREGRVIESAVWSAQQSAVRYGLGMKSETRVGVGPLMASLVMHRVTERLLQHYEQLSVLIQVASPGLMLDQLNRGELDLVIGPLVVSATHKLERQLLFEDELAVYASGSHPLAGAERVEISDLNDFDWINLGTYTFFGESPVELLQRAGVERFNTAIAVSGDAAIGLNAMASGQYLSLMPARLTSQAEQVFGLKRLPVDGDFGRRDMYLWYRPAVGNDAVMALIRESILEVLGLV